MPKVGPQIEVIHGNCLTAIPARKDYALVFCDPPFNIDQKYDGYDDNVTEEDYGDFVSKFIYQCCMKCTGVMCLHGNDYLCALYLEKVAGLVMKRIAWINWHYRFGQCSRSNWIDARCHCLVYAMGTGAEYTWNPEEVLVESDRVAYGDKRVSETERGGKRLPGTVWGIPSDGPYWGRVQGNNEERRPNHPNQLPEVYLARLIRAYTNKGDWILDPFGGSGVTAVVAQALGRNCVTIDISKESCASIKERLEKGAVRV